MSKIFKPRRGSATTMNGSKASTVLAEGELFFEYPSTGVGTGECKIKLGDGSTAYSSLPYAVDGTAISSKAVTVTSNSSSTITAALNNVATGKTLGVIVGALKQAVSLCNTSITALNDDKTALQNQLKANNKSFYFDYKNGSYGYNTSSTRGADTFVPFKKTLILLAVSGYFNAGSFTVRSWTTISNTNIILSALMTENIPLGNYTPYFTGTLSLTGSSTIKAVKAGTYEVATNYSGTEVISEITLSAGGTFTIPNKNNFHWTICKK